MTDEIEIFHKNIEHLDKYWYKSFLITNKTVHIWKVHYISKTLQ